MGQNYFISMGLETGESLVLPVKLSKSASF